MSYFRILNPDVVLSNSVRKADVDEIPRRDQEVDACSASKLADEVKHAEVKSCDVRIEAIIQCLDEKVSVWLGHKWTRFVLFRHFWCAQGSTDF